MPTDDDHTPTPRCPTCGFEGKAAQQPGGEFACPSCGELWETEGEAKPEDLTLPDRKEFEVLGHELIGQLSSGIRDKAPLEESSLKSTDDKDAGGAEKSRKKKRPRNPKRLARQVGWDEEVKKPKRVRRTRWRRWKAEAIKALGGLTLAALAILLVYAVAIALKRARQDVAPAPAESSEDGPPPIALETLPTDERRAVIEQIELAFRGFLESDSLAERLKFVRDPERVRPLMESYYRKHPIAPIPVRDLPDGQKYRSRATLATTTLLMEDYTTRPIAVQRDAAGAFKVDWESFVGQCEIPWSKMLTDRPSEPFLVRAMVSLSTERSDRWPSGSWRAWQLEDRDGTHRLYGFSSNVSRPHIEIAVAMKNARRPGSGRPRLPMTLEIAFPVDAPEGIPHVEIVKLHAIGWVVSSEIPE